MTRKRKTKRDMAMSQTMKVIRNAHPGMAQTQVLSMASKQLSERNKTGGILPLLPLGIWGHDRIIGLKVVRAWVELSTTERYRNVFKTLQMNEL